MGSKLVYYMHRIYKTNCVIILLHRSYRTWVCINEVDVICSESERYFLTRAKQIRDKIQLGISIAVTN